jgi:hypothetical protein
MARLPLSSAALALAVAVALDVASPLAAQTARTAPTSSDPASISTAPVANPPATSAPRPAPTEPAAPRRNRAISGDVATMLAHSMPKFTPPPPPPPPPTAAELAKKAEEDAADLRETDKPKNAIVRLEKYVVQEKRPPIFTEREIHTKKGLTALAMRRYISDSDRALNRWTLPLFGSSAESRALLMYAEDERLKNMADLADNANMIMKSDSAAGSAAKDAVQKTYMRSGDFGYGGMGKK